MTMQRTGFTLIELLVVITIIAILAAILFPVFAKAREKARQTACSSNEKQLGLALMQYNQDNDEAFPPGIGGYGVGWAGPSQPYIKSAALFKCPDDSTQQMPDPANTANTLYPISYALNSNVANQTIASLNAPASTVLLSEAFGSQARIDQTDEGYTANNATTLSPSTNGIDDPAGAAHCVFANLAGGTSNGKLKFATGVLAGGPTGIQPVNNAADFTGTTGIHTDGANYLLADGHVKYLRPAQVSAGKNGYSGADQEDACGASYTDPTDTGSYHYHAAATDTMYIDPGHTQPVAATFSRT